MMNKIIKWIIAIACAIAFFSGLITGIIKGCI